MEWLSKAIEVLKIPLKVILPAAWLFSGALIFMNDQILKKLELFEWKTENGFVLGLTFAITSCLIVVYILYFAKNSVFTLLSKLTQKQRTLKNILQMSPMEFSIIVKLYTSPGFTAELDYGQPIVQGMLARNYIYSGRQQLVTMNVFTNAIPVRCTLQPFVYQALDHYRPKVKGWIWKLEKKISKEKNVTKKAQLSETLQNLRDFYVTIYGVEL